MRRALVWVCLVALALGCAGCGRRPSTPADASQPTAAEPRPEAGRPQGPALDARCAPYVLERIGRPVIGFALAASEVPQSALSAEQRDWLGEAAFRVESLCLPEIGEMAPVRVEWAVPPGGESADRATPESEWLWAFRRGIEKLYVSPWLEVLGAGDDVVRLEESSSHEAVLSSGFAILGRDAGEGAQMTIGSPDGKEWGVPGGDVGAALRACFLAKLGRADEAAEAAAQAGEGGFARLPATLTYLAHRSAIEGVAGGWPRAVALQTLERAAELGAADYAGADRLRSDREVLTTLAAQDRMPPGDPSKAKPGEPQWARYHLRRLCDAGAPEILSLDKDAGDPVVRLVSGGPAATEALSEALDDARMTRMLATDVTGPLPDLLRIGDIAFDILAGSDDRALLTERGVARLHALPEADRAEVIRRVRRSIDPGARPG